MPRKTIFLLLLFLCVTFTTLFLYVWPVCSQVTQTAVIACSSANWDSGAHSIISVDPVGGPRSYKNNLLPTSCSDITVVAYGSYFYRIERFNADNVTKFSITAPATPIWQYSTKDDSDTVTSTNPYDIIFASDHKAYLLRNNTPTAWIIDPSTSSEEGFKTGELDLSAYLDQDGKSPEMAHGVIVDQKLFILLQRANQNNNWAPNTPYLAVFDTETNIEIDTNMPNPDGFLGIPLPLKNPSAIQYVAMNNTIYIQGVGRYESQTSAAEYSGGIVTVNPATYETALLLDDGDENTHPYGNITGLAVLSPTKGYFIGYAGWGQNTLYAFNPSNGAVAGVVDDYLKDKNIAGLEAGVYGDKNERLWVCNATETDAEVVIINTDNNSIDEKISTNLNPQKVIFVTGTPSSFSDNNSNNNNDDDDNDIIGGCFITTVWTRYF